MTLLSSTDKVNGLRASPSSHSTSSLPLSCWWFPHKFILPQILSFKIQTAEINKSEVCFKTKHVYWSSLYDKNKHTSFHNASSIITSGTSDRPPSSSVWCVVTSYAKNLKELGHRCIAANGQTTRCWDIAASPPTLLPLTLLFYLH